MIKKKIKMDLSISNSPQVVYAVQGDTNTRNVVIDLYNAGAAWTVPDGASGVVKFQKADGKGGIYDKLPNGFPAVVYEENSNQIEVSLAPQVLTFPGEVKAQVSLIYDNNIISTFSFVVLVQEDPSANAEKSTDYVNWDRYFIPQTSGASVGQYLKITKVDDLGRVVEVSPVDAPSGSGTIGGDLDMESKSILNLRSLEFWNEDELATVIMQSEFPDGDNESEDFNGVVEFRTSRGDEPVVIRNVADAKNPNEAVSKKQLDESMDHSKLSNRDAAGQHPIEAITGLREILDEVKNGSDGNAGQGGFTQAQINALHGMFKVCLFDDTKDVDGAISAFETAFGITGGGEVPDEPDQPGGGSGGITGDALPTNGLMAYFDLRNLGDKANVTVGTTKGVMATQGSGALFSWASQPITSSDEYGAVLPRVLLYNPSGQSAEYDMGNEFTVVVCTRGGVSGWNMTGSNVAYGIAEPVYVTADGTAKAAKIEITGDRTGYNTQTYRINGETQTMYLNGIKIAEYVGSETDGFVKWESKPTFGTIWSGGTVVAATVYNRPLSETEIVEVQAFMKTLEVTA